MITTAAHEINQGRPPHLEPGRRPGPRLLLHRPPRPRSGRWRRSSRWSPSGPRRASASTRSARSRCWRRCTGGRSGSTRSTSACRRELNPDGERALSDRFRIGDRLIQTRNSHELGLMNGSIVFLRARRPRRGGDRRRHRRRRLAGHPLRRDRRRCGSPTRSRSTRRRAARSRSSSASATARTRGC